MNEGPRRFTNVIEESRINRIRIFAVYGDSVAYSKYPSDNRCPHRGNPVTCLKLRNQTITLLLFIEFAVALTFIMLFDIPTIVIYSFFVAATMPF